jgi:cytochrome c-type biogenesis protein CcmF
MSELPQIDLPLAPQWSLIVGAMGRILIGSGAVLFLLSALATLLKKKPQVTRLATPLFVAGCTTLFASFVALGSLFVADQFQFEYIYARSEANNGIGYKIAAIWSGQQGSFLLWGCCSALFALLALRGTGPYRGGFLFAGSVFLAAICGILIYESPFVVGLIHGLPYMPPEGVGLNPQLNNYWVIIHPPTIFLGFGSLLVLFGYAVAALMNRDYHDWVPRVRSWVLISLTLVGLGLCMGGFWAYETLGWGGFWAWDPVENVSFVPWIIVAILIHGLIVQTAKGKWIFSNLLLAGLSFLSFVYGTFLTRAGFLDGVSVHSFAQMDSTAHKLLLGFFFGSLIGFVGLWLFRLLKTDEPEPEPDPGSGVHREGMYRFGALFLGLMGAATAIGMSVPLIQGMTGQQPKVVEEYLYHAVLSWFFIPTMILMAIGPFVSWRKMSLRSLLLRILNVVSITFGLMGLILIWINHSVFGVRPEPGAAIDMPGPWSLKLVPWMMVLIGVCMFAIVANVWRVFEIWNRSKPGTGAFLAHIGVAVALAGLIVSRGFERKQEFLVQQGGIAFPLEEKGPRAFASIADRQKFDVESLLNRDNKVELQIMGDFGNFTAWPGFYYARAADGGVNPMVWPHIERRLSHDVYIAFHQPQFDAGEPKNLTEGQTAEFRAFDWTRFEEKVYQVRYERLTQEGQPGQRGTKFGALLRVEGPRGITEVNPTISVGGGFEPDPIDGDFMLELVSMDAGTRSVQLQLKYMRPVFLVELFYKPMTILVWIGTGILTVGGLLSAWHRRRRRTLENQELSAEETPKASPAEKDALEPVA